MTNQPDLIDRFTWPIRLLILALISFGLFMLSQNIGHANQNSVHSAIRNCSDSESVAWPACARQGGLTAGMMQGAVRVLGSAEIADDTRQNLFAADAETVSAAECVIPESGPWPPCARGESPASSNTCVIPESGPWPPCATGGNTSNGGVSSLAASNTAAESAAFDASFNAAFNRLYNINANGSRAGARVPLSYNEMVDGNMQAATLNMRPLVVPFSPHNLMVASSVVRGAADTMGGSLDRFYNRPVVNEFEACDAYGSAYVLAANSPQFTNVPSNWQAMVGQYEAAIFTLLDSNQDRMVQDCITNGQYSTMYVGMARAGVNRAQEQIQPVMEAALESSAR